jgi:hypothetical protein
MTPVEAEEAGWVVGWVAVQKSSKYAGFVANMQKESLSPSSKEGKWTQSPQSQMLWRHVGYGKRFVTAPIVVARMIVQETHSVYCGSALTLWCPPITKMQSPQAAEAEWGVCGAWKEGFDLVSTAPIASPLPAPAMTTTAAAYLLFQHADCVLSNWTSWSRCSKTCGRGQQYRTRTILQEHQGGLVHTKI